MAARTDIQLQLVCCTYEGKKFSVPLARAGMKTRDVIAEAARIVNVKANRLSVLWCGKVIDPDMPIQDAIANRTATDLHLVQLNVAEQQIFTGQLASIDDEQVFVYCKECEGLADGKQVLICSICNEKNKFVRQSPAPTGMFDVEYKTDGTCLNTNCPSNKQVVSAQVTYECKGCNNSAAVLKHVHKNINSICCIKCNNNRAQMFVFFCDYLHAICLQCFSGYCQMQMNNKKFQVFDNIGFSICCPAPSCTDSPVRDPHHFYLVNEKFYSMFQQRAVECYQPPGDNIFCTCRTEIDVLSHSSSNDDETVTTIEEKKSSWFSFKTRASKKGVPTKKTHQRGRVTCPKCNQAYCKECKSFWHSEDCVVQAESTDDNVFDIYEPWEKASRWPKQS